MNEKFIKIVKLFIKAIGVYVLCMSSVLMLNFLFNQKLETYSIALISTLMIYGIKYFHKEVKAILRQEKIPGVGDRMIRRIK